MAPATPTTPAVAPATPAVTPATPLAPATPFAPAAPVTTALIAILAKPEDSRDPHVCPFFLPRNFSSAGTPMALAAIWIGGRSAFSGQRNPATTSPSSPTSADAALAGPATARSSDPPTLGWLGNRRLASPRRDRWQWPAIPCCLSVIKDRTRAYFRKRANGSSYRIVSSPSTTGGGRLRVMADALPHPRSTQAGRGTAREVSLV